MSDGEFKKRLQSWFPDRPNVSYLTALEFALKLVKEAMKDFNECCSMQDYLITKNKWFGENE